MYQPTPEQHGKGEKQKNLSYFSDLKSSRTPKTLSDPKLGAAPALRQQIAYSQLPSLQISENLSHESLSPTQAPFAAHPMDGKTTQDTLENLIPNTQNSPALIKDPSATSISLLIASPGHGKTVSPSRLGSTGVGELHVTSIGD